MTDQEKDQRVKAVHHVVHKYANFVSSAKMVNTGPDVDGVPLKPPLDTHVSHAFYLNCRKLADFFQNKKFRGDVKAKHYVPCFRADLPVSDNWQYRGRGPTVVMSRP